MEVIDVTMVAIETIFCMLDWNNPIETQELGRLLAKDLTNLDLFCQPFCEKYNKNVWENCAIILSEKRDAELQPYLTKMLEWLQDLNRTYTMKQARRSECNCEHILPLKTHSRHTISKRIFTVMLSLCMGQTEPSTSATAMTHGAILQPRCIYRT